MVSHTIQLRRLQGCVEIWYELDLVLRNNITTEECPLGLFHPHAEYHHIKKENIGLIEVMGLAVLPARLKKEMAELEQAILNHEDLRQNETMAAHADWAEEWMLKYEITDSNIHSIGTERNWDCIYESPGGCRSL